MSRYREIFSLLNKYMYKYGNLVLKKRGIGGSYMDYKRIVMEMLDKEIKEDDFIFLKQLYTIIKRHIEKRKDQ